MDADRRARLKRIKRIVAQHSEQVAGLQCFPHTMTIIRCQYLGHWFKASGHSECGKHDVWDADRGFLIAEGRAQKAMTLMIEAWERRHHAEQIKPDLSDIWAGREVTEAAVA